MIPSFIDRSQLPSKSGVYIFKDKAGGVLYIGKAINLLNRVGSYFNSDRPLKTANLVANISGVETIIVESELEALILEANLIKKHRPPFNVRLVDDKDYLYIALTGGGSATKEQFPKVITARKKDLSIVKKYWGPFPSSKTVGDTLRALRKVFPWCAGIGHGRACFYYHLGLCPGVCVGAITKLDYHKIINRFHKFMDGKKEELVQDLTAEMQAASKTQHFEQADKVKKIVEGILYLTQPNRVHLYLENPNFLQEERQLALEQLQKDLELKKLPTRIEGYDISNIQGKDATGSMVVLTNGEIDKSQYRKFKIHISGRPNDVGMHKEMIGRRLKNDWPLPDLIIVDGGRGQARAVGYELQTANLKLPVFGLAKKMEWLYPPKGEIIKLLKSSLSLKLLQKIRDESHRFALAYHRKLHQKSVILK